MMRLKFYTQYASKFGKLSSGHRTGKDQFSLQLQRQAMPKNVQITIQLHYFTCHQGNAQNPSSRFQQYMNREFPGVQAGFRKGRETRDQIATIH